MRGCRFESCRGNSMNSALRRLLVPLLRSVHAGKPISFRMKSAAGQALFLVQRKPSPSRKKPAQARKEVKRALHREETGAIRAAVFARAFGWCELDTTEFHAATDLHHLEGGSGRRALQRASNCMAVCRLHHDLFHRRPEVFRNRILNWCTAYGYPVPRRFLRPAPAAPPTPPSGERSGAGQEET